jgi:hypothetical protein
MARANMGSGKKAAKKTRVRTGRTKKARKKQKVAVSQQPQAGAAPFVPDNQSWDAAAQLIAQSRRDHTAAIRSQSEMSPGFPGNIPPQQQPASATLTADSSLTADATVVNPYSQMLARLAELEATVAQLPPLLLPSAPGIGHNNPPPLDRAELEEIKADIALLKAQPPPAPVEANNIASKFVRLGERVLAWCSKQLDTFATEFMKAAGKAAGTTAGKALVLSPLWLVFGQQLTDSAAAIMQWVMTLPGLGQ